MSAVRKNPDAFALQVMLGLCLIWGCQQVLIKFAAGDIAPVMQAALRNGIAAVLVGLMLCWRGAGSKSAAPGGLGWWPVGYSVWSSCSLLKG